MALSAPLQCMSRQHWSPFAQEYRCKNVVDFLKANCHHEQWHKSTCGASYIYLKEKDIQWDNSYQ